MSPACVRVSTSSRGRREPIGPTCSNPPYMDIRITSGADAASSFSASTDALSSHATVTGVPSIYSCNTSFIAGSSVGCGVCGSSVTASAAVAVGAALCSANCVGAGCSVAVGTDGCAGFAQASGTDRISASKSARIIRVFIGAYAYRCVRRNDSIRSNGMAFLPPPSYRSVCVAPGISSSSLLSAYLLSRIMFAYASLPK